MLEKIIVLALIVAAGAYLARRFMKKGANACGCSGAGSHPGCCGGTGHELKPMSQCGCSRKS